MNLKKSLLPLLALCASLSATVQGQTTFESEDLKVWIDDLSIEADSSTVAYLRIYEHDDTRSYSAFNLSIDIPKGLAVNRVKKGREWVDDIHLTERAATSHSIACNITNDGTLLKIACFSDQTDDFYPDDEDGNPLDEICYIGLIAAPTMENGDYSLVANGIKFVCSNELAYYPADKVEAVLTITEGVEPGEKSPNTLTFVNEPNKADNPANYVAKDADDNWVANSIALVDACPFASPYDFTAAEITYARNFAKDTWQALFVPYNMGYDEWGAIGEVAEYVGAYQAIDEDNGQESKIIISFETVKAGELTPNTPYIIKPKEIGECVFFGQNKIVAATPADGGAIAISAADFNAILAGTYQFKTDMYDTHSYALSNGAFHPAASANAVLQPFRIFLTRQNDSAPARKVQVVIDGNGVSEVEGIEIDFAEGIESAYDLIGRKISTPDKGVYIINGKKKFIK